MRIIFNDSVQLVLASRSPRRKALLEKLGLSFRVIPSNIDETLPDAMHPRKQVTLLSQQKAQAISTIHQNALVMGVDTLVVHENCVLGKPSGAEEAAAFLRRLSGSTHTVMTGITLIHQSSGRTATSVETTEVTFGALTEQEIHQYVASGSPMDKAGAYGIQDDRGALFVEKITGDYYTVVGLPLRRMYLMLRQHFPDFMIV